MQNDYCKIYLDTDFPKNVVIDAIRSATAGYVEGRATIRTAFCVIDVEENGDFDEDSRHRPADGFLYYRYYLDVEPLPGRDRSAYIEALSSLLRDIRDSGSKAVPACDFEDQLPQS